MMDYHLRIAIPNKGRLKKPALNLLSSAGLEIVDRGGRTLISRTSDPNVKVIFMRPADIPRIVEIGAVDLGITGHDLIVESRADIVEVLDLKFGRAKVVVATHNPSIVTVEDITPDTKVATRYPNITREFFAKTTGVIPKIIKVTGALEVTPLLGIAEAIVDVSATGTTLRIHGLKVIGEVMRTSARLIASVRPDRAKMNKLDEIVSAIRSVVMARRRSWIIMNVPDRCLKDVVSVLPSMAGPTISKVEAEEPMWEVNTVVSDEEVYRVILEAKKRGARDILVLKIDRLIP